jgi:hypothetical protein
LKYWARPPQTPASLRSVLLRYNLRLSPWRRPSRGVPVSSSPCRQPTRCRDLREPAWAVPFFPPGGVGVGGPVLPLPGPALPSGGGRGPGAARGRGPGHAGVDPTRGTTARVALCPPCERRPPGVPRSSTVASSTPCSIRSVDVARQDRLPQERAAWLDPDGRCSLARFAGTRERQGTMMALREPDPAGLASRPGTHAREMGVLP